MVVVSFCVEYLNSMLPLKACAKSPEPPNTKAAKAIVFTILSIFKRD
jgi:hypothetical protein